MASHPVYLSVGDGATSDALDLTSGAYRVQYPPGVQYPTPEAGSPSREVRVPLRLRAASHNALVAAKRAIETKLRQARLATGPHGKGARVTLGLRLASNTALVYFDVQRGRFETELVFDGWLLGTLVLTCDVHARGDDLTVTNLLAYSDRYDDATWTKTSVTVTANATAGPDGSTTADTLAPTAADSALYQSVGVTASTAYALSFWLRSTGADRSLTIGVYDAVGAAIATQAVTVTGTWTQHTVLCNSGANTTLRAQIGGGSSWSTGEDVYAWGAVLEPGTAASGVYLRHAGAVTQVNGGEGWYLYGLPGDAPAAFTLTLPDASLNSNALNGLRLGAANGDDLKLGDYTPVVDLAFASPATNTVDATAYGGGYAGRSITSGTSWAEHATATLPDTPYAKGRFEVLARLFDNVTRIAAPTAFNGTPTESTTTATTTETTTANETPAVGFTHAGSGTNVTSFVLTGMATPTAGALLLCFVYHRNNGTSDTPATVTSITGGNTFTKITRRTITKSGTTKLDAMELWYVENAAASITDPTVALTGQQASQTSYAVVLEVENVKASAVIDRLTYGFGQNDPSFTLQTSLPSQLVVALAGSISATAGATFWDDGFVSQYNANGIVIGTRLVDDAGASVNPFALGNETTDWSGFCLTCSPDTTTTPTTTTTVDEPAPGNLNSGSYSATLAAVDYAGSTSTVATTADTLTNNGGKIAYSWVAPSTGGVSHYRLAVTYGGVVYEALLAGSATAYTLTDLAHLAVVEAAPSAAGTSFARWRLYATTDQSGAQYPAPPFQLETSNAWGLAEAGLLDLPPAQRLDDGSQPRGKLGLQTLWSGAGSNAVRADCAWLFPAGNTASLRYATGGRTSPTNITWVFEARADGTAAGDVRASGAHVATVDVRGRVLLGPRRAHLAWVGLDGGFDPDPVNLQVGAPTLVLRPRYLDLAGTVS